LWRSLESFDGRCSMRTWAAYVFIRIRVLDRAYARAHQLDLDMLDRMEDRT